MGSFDISVEKSWTLFAGVELVSFNFGLPGWVGFLEVFGKKKDWDLQQPELVSGRFGTILYWMAFEIR